MNKSIATVSAAALCASAVLVVPAAGPATSAPPAPSGVTLAKSTIAWGVCTDPGLVDAGARCANLTVPMDYAKPDGRKITLALSRVAHTSSAAEFQGVMLVNPGGPGGSGVGLSILGDYVPGDVGGKYDWIGWDPRGVGESRPALSCKPNYLGYDRPPYVPKTTKLLKTWKDRSKSYAKACKKARPNLIKHVKTRDTVKDMESIRTALGAEQINYYGFSYGTYLGGAYATAYPSKVRRMVLDGNVDPRRVWYKANLDQDLAFERNINIWFKWLAKYDDYYDLGDTRKKVSKLFYEQIKLLDKNAAGGVIGGDEWTDVFIGAGYYQVTWLGLADAFSAWVHDGDWSLLKAEYDASATPGDDNGYAMYNATQCTDAKWPKKWSTWQKDNDRIYKKAKFLTWDNAWYNAPCKYWKAKAGKKVKVGSSQVASALLVSQTLDAATPYAGSLEMRKRFPNSRLVAEPGGTTHSGSLFGNACTDGAIAAYLDTGALPDRKPGRTADKICQPLPKPVPGLTEGLRQSLTEQRVDRPLVGRP